MKKTIFTLLAVLATCGLFAQIQSDLVIKKGVDIEPNGLEDDPVWAQIAPVAITKVFNYESPTVESYFKMYYTDEYIYILVNVDDDLHYPAWLAEDTKNEWLYDKVELYFDVNNVLKDGKGPAYIDGFMAPGHYQMAPALKEDGYGAPYEPTNVIYGSLSGLATVAYTLKDDYRSYIMEYRFPMYGFVNDLEDEMNLNMFKELPQGLGFDILVVDNDNDGASRKRAVWKNIGPTEPYSNMDNCGVVTFSDESVSAINSPRVPVAMVYPNPVTTKLFIEGDFDKIVLSNIAGQELRVTETERVVDMSGVANGIYILKTYKNGILNGATKVTKQN
ncbi:MAG: sugar-binding protein [Paludibacter sp.]|jgi:hypothetical protein|nr:sugar-binding protein [Paludibacter sp.]